MKGGKGRERKNEKGTDGCSERWSDRAQVAYGSVEVVSAGDQEAEAVQVMPRHVKGAAARFRPWPASFRLLPLLSAARPHRRQQLYRVLAREVQPMSLRSRGSLWTRAPRAAESSLSRPTVMLRTMFTLSHIFRA